MHIYVYAYIILKHSDTRRNTYEVTLHPQKHTHKQPLHYATPPKKHIYALALKIINLHTQCYSITDTV